MTGDAGMRGGTAALNCSQGGSVARFGPIDMRAQAEVRGAQRSDTPKRLVSLLRTMCPKQIGGSAFRAEVGRTDAGRATVLGKLSR